MTEAPGARAVRVGGLSLALLLLSTCASDHPADITVEGTDGEAASLPCECPPDRPPFLVWQKVTDKQPLVVNYYRDDNQEDELVASEYRNRTELKLRGNCSLVFHSLSLSDQGLYECYYKKSPLRKKIIHLVVAEKHQQLPVQKDQSTIVTSSVCVFLIVIAIAAACVGITRRKKHQMTRTFIATSMSSI